MYVCQKSLRTGMGRVVERKKEVHRGEGEWVI
jgi:hypothetical protein